MTDRAENDDPRSWAYRWLQPWALDTRSLATFRIAVGSVLLWDRLSRLGDINSMYADSGIMPLQVVREAGGGHWHWSLHMWSGEPWWQWLLMISSILMAVGLIFGFRTRVCCVGSWLLASSLHYRVPLLVSGGDVILAMMLFWGMFLPLGERWSLDRRRIGGRPRTRIVSVAAFAVQLQICAMYLITAVAKMQEPVWISGEALQNVLSYDVLTRPLGRALQEYPPLLQAITWSTLVIEIAGPLLLLCPWATRWTRPAGMLLIGSLHLGIELTMRVVIFSQTCWAALTVFTPSQFWDGSVWRRFPALTGASRSSAANPLAHDTNTPEMSAPETGRSRSRWLHHAGEACCLVLLVFVLVFATGRMIAGDRFLAAMPESLKTFERMGMLGQRWSMFVRPIATDFRFVAVVNGPDQTTLDVLHDGEVVDLNNPEQISARFRNQRWMLAFRELTENYNSPFRQSVAGYLLDDWNARHPRQSAELLDLLACQLHLQESRPSGTAPDAVGGVEIYRYARADLLAEGPFRLGQRHGHWTLFHSRGVKAAEGSYADGREKGTWTHWHPNGQLKSEGAYIDGYEDGPWQHWFSDGTLQSAGSFDRGKEQGKWVYHYEDGRRAEVWFDQGQPITVQRED